MSKVLCVVTSHGVKGSTGEQTGFWLSELTHPLEKMQNTGVMKSFRNNTKILLNYQM